MTIKCTAISDTHTHHGELSLKGGDILFHAGDATFLGQPDEVYPFLEWLSKQDYEHKIFIAGNHDFGFEPVGEGVPCSLDGFFVFRGYTMQKGLEKEYREAADELGIIYLHNELTTIEGLRIFGSPYQPAFCGWAFNTSEYQALEQAKAWPKNLDVLMTHGPAKGIRDKVARRSLSEGGPDPRVGCTATKKYIKEHAPKYHIFGHIHNGYGVTRGKNTTYINASNLDDSYREINPPINFRIKDK